MRLFPYHLTEMVIYLYFLKNVYFFQAQSDIEWKYGLAKLIRNMHRTTTTPSPLNLVMTWLMYFLRACHAKGISSNLIISFISVKKIIEFLL